MKNKTAAMFGLDARIALAIFGSLSLISGVALFSAIKKSKIVKIITEMREVEKALSSYILDTSRYLASSTNVLKLEPLLQDSSIKGWDGPYLSGVMINEVTMKYANNMNMQLVIIDSETLGDCVSTSKYCYHYIGFMGESLNLDLLKAMETMVDGTKNPPDSNLAGSFGYFYNDVAKIGDAYLKTSIPYPPRLAP